MFPTSRWFVPLLSNHCSKDFTGFQFNIVGESKNQVRLIACALTGRNKFYRHLRRTSTYTAHTADGKIQGSTSFLVRSPLALTPKNLENFLCWVVGEKNYYCSAHAVQATHFNHTSCYLSLDFFYLSHYIQLTRSHSATLKCIYPDPHLQNHT